MFDRIVYISDRSCDVKLKSDADITFNLMNLHLVFEDKDKRILGEVDDIKDDVVKVRFVGEITPRGLVSGVIRKPTLDAKVRVITQAEVPLVTGRDRRGYMLIGKSPFYADKDVFMDVNGFFSNHFAIFGNSGSGKSCGVSRIFQNMFHDERLFPYKSNIIMFDSSAEYYNAFKNLSSINPNYNYRFISTNEQEGLGEPLRVPIYLLNEDDIALLLNVTSHSQLPIIERMLKLARIFSEDKTDTVSYKNHLIAKAIMTILYTNETSPNKRNEIFSILASCSTPDFTLETEIKGVGYTRKFRDCFLIDQFGNFTESVLMTEYISSFIKDEYDSYEPSGNVFYDLDTLEKALNFTLISEGWLRNENTYADAVTIKVRLHALITGNNSKFFDYPNYVSLEQFISSLLIVNGKKYQLVNINLDDVDDEFAKVIVKIYSRLIFTFAKSLGDRASIPFHLVVEEAHRYIQNDTDTFLIGYNIFDRIAKEGRKYGVLLGLITQRPVEMSDTVISQCSNFLIFKMNHPADVDYIRKMVPNISEEIVEKQKTLQPGTCLAFGQTFKIPLIVRLEMPNPAPYSGNCDVVNIWDGNNGKNKSEEEESEEEYVRKVEEEALKEINGESVIKEEKKEVKEEVQPVEEKTKVEEPKEENNVQEEKTTIEEPISQVVDNNEEKKEDNNPQESVEIPQNNEIELPVVPQEEEKKEEKPVIDTTVDIFGGTAAVDNSNEMVIPNTNNIEPQAEITNNETEVNNNVVIPEINTVQDVSNVVTPAVTEPQETTNVGNQMPPLNPSSNVNDMLGVSNDVVTSPIPDITIPENTSVVPQDAANINIGDQFSEQQSLSPNIQDDKQDEGPSIIIPAGQGVDSSILQGFGGAAVMEENKTSE